MRQSPYLLLIRPANLLTSATDIAAGAAIAVTIGISGGGAVSFGGFILLILASMALYAGGIAFNDVFDAGLDRIERPERPIPSGQISLRQAAGYAAILLLLGILLALWHSLTSGIIAAAIALFAVIYNNWSKHHAFAGPLNMGFLRSLNLLLGLSLLPVLIPTYYGLGVFPLLYIFAITMISRGEVHGGPRRTLYLALLLYLSVDLGILIYAGIQGRWLLPLLFVVAHLAYVLPPLRKAIQLPEGPRIGRAVKHGVLGMILMDAIWVSMSPSPYWIWAFAMILLLPVSQKLARHFAVT